MAYSAWVGSFNIDTAKTAGQDQVVSWLGVGPAFTPKLILFWWGGAVGNGDAVAAGTYNLGFGAAISSSSRFCTMTMSVDAGSSSDSLRSQATTEVIRCYTDVATLDGIADFKTMDASGFTLTIDDQFTQTYRISYLALGGTDLTNVYIGKQYRSGRCR